MMNSDPSAAPPSLHLDVDEIRHELDFSDPATAARDMPAADSELEQRAKTYADRLAALDPANFDLREAAKTSVETVGRDLQGRAAHQSRLLKQAISTLNRDGAENGPVANALVDLKIEVERLDPHKFDFGAGWLTRLLGKLPGVGTPLKRYFSQFESAQTVLDAIVRSLQDGQGQLKRDNLILKEDQRAMHELTQKLKRQIALAELVDRNLEVKLARELKDDEARANFIQEELLFPLRQRIMDLQQQLAVNQQGMLANGLIARNNQELIHGVDRALDVTVSALNVAVTTALALANQKIVLDKINALNQTTNDLIRNTARQIRSQGAAIQTQAAGSMIDLQVLRAAFTDINAALDDIARYRRDALPKMAENILEFDQLATQAEAQIDKIRLADQTAPELSLDV